MAARGPIAAIHQQSKALGQRPAGERATGLAEGAEPVGNRLGSWWHRAPPCQTTTTFGRGRTRDFVPGVVQPRFHPSGAHVLGPAVC